MIALALAIVAYADAIGMGPTDCAPGSYPASSHCGEWCEPSVCALSIPPPCGPSGTCESVGICLHATTRPQSCGMGWTPDTPDVPVTVAAGACTTDGDCAAGDHCEIAYRCVEATSLPPVFDGGSSGLSCPFAMGVPLLGLGLIGLAGSRPDRSARG